MVHVVVPLGVAVALFGSLGLAHEVGYILGRRARRKGRETPGLTAVQGAMLGLLGLLLAFSYAGAAQRFGERQELLVRETNAIGTLQLRTAMLDEPARGAVRATLREYIRARLELHDAESGDDRDRILGRMATLQNRMWDEALAGVGSNTALGMLVMPAINDVLDLLAERNAAADRHLPALVLLLLMVSAVTSIATVAYGFGLSGGRHLATMWALVLVIACSLWMTVDLDYPRHGLIRMDLTPLDSLRAILSQG